MYSDGPSESVVMRHRGSDRAPRQKSSSTPSLLGRGDCSVPITCPRLGRPGALGSPTGSPFALILIDETSPVFRRTVASIRPWRRLIAEEGVVGVRACRSGRTDPVAGSFCVYLPAVLAKRWQPTADGANRLRRGRPAQVANALRVLPASVRQAALLTHGVRPGGLPLRSAHDASLRGPCRRSWSRSPCAATMACI